MDFKHYNGTHRLTNYVFEHRLQEFEDFVDGLS